MKTNEKEKQIYDTVIVGAGPAGLSASVYLSRYGLSNIVVGDLFGGLTTKTNDIGNWLGDQMITGFDFAKKAVDHVKSYGTELVVARVKDIKQEGIAFALELDNGEVVHAKSVLLATGTEHRHLHIPGEAEFAGRGVSYCATCDGFFFKDKTVAVVGGNDSAAVASLYLADIAKKVYIVYRGAELRAEEHWKKRIAERQNIEVIYNTNITEIKGDSMVTSIMLDVSHNDLNELPVDGIFVEIGSVPKIDFAQGLQLALDDAGYIIIDEQGRTSCEGVWAAGDTTTGSNKFKQIITAAAEGAIAANGVQMWLKK